MLIRLQIVCVLALLIPDVSQAEGLYLKTADKLTIAADWHPPVVDGKAVKMKGVIVALHMFRSDRKAWGPMLAPAANRGLGMLVLDLRGHGESSKQGREDLAKRAVARDATLFNAMHQDVAAAVKWLADKKKVAASDIVLFGASVGCSVALDYGARNPDIRAAVLLTPGKKYLGVDSMKHILGWTGRPVLMVSSEEEADNGAIPLYKASLAPRRVVVMQLPQKKIHGTRMFSKVKRIEERLIEWAVARLAETPVRAR
ncbi:MAG: hypothetical protein COB76_04960 [Alphaproteobacteria bacterium]|nr:MAG: hypothetical protein COB76_04960 [Alphaproteobacteria bacterium]